MWSKVVRKGVKWLIMTAESEISKLTGGALLAKFLPFDLKLTGKCPN